MKTKYLFFISLFLIILLVLPVSFASTDDSASIASIDDSASYLNENNEADFVKLPSNTIENKQEPEIVNTNDKNKTGGNEGEEEDEDDEEDNEQ